MDKNTWTITKKWKAGDTAMACFHRVRIEEILEECDGYNVARVTVLGPVPGANGTTQAGFDKEGNPLRVNNPIPVLPTRASLTIPRGCFKISR